MKALIAMSGGVDSSVAAGIMIERGYECTGCMMKLFDVFDVAEDEESFRDEKTCCSVDDAVDARNVASRLNMPFYVLNFKDEFKEKVIDHFVRSYESGVTPNPCIECNKYLKFGKLYEKAKELGCDTIVTGHYARIEKSGDEYVLKKAKEPSKDQSYVLYGMTQELLKHTVFPLGDMSKDETRAIAERKGFINSNKPDSQDICFVPDGDYASVVERYSRNKPQTGDFVYKDGTVLGKHKGIIHYTIGQRKGLNISFSKPLYVCEICPSECRVMLGDNEDLFKDTFKASEVNWISLKKPAGKLRCSAKVRYRHKEEPGELEFLDDETVRFVFDEKQRAITPGQAAVFYDGDIVLGGGVIKSIN